jgi:nitroreductase
VNRAEILFDLIRKRRSIRRFRNESVERELLDRLIEAACYAPSAGNRQDWEFTVITSADTIRDVANAVRRRWNAIVAANRDMGLIDEVEGYAKGFANFEQAPVIVLVSAKHPDGFQERLLGDDARATAGGEASAAMAAQNLMLMAHALGLGSCCMTGALAARDEIARITGLDRRQEIVCLVAVGYPDETPAAPARKPITETGRFLE